MGRRSGTHSIFIIDRCSLSSNYKITRSLARPGGTDERRLGMQCHNVQSTAGSGCKFCRSSLIRLGSGTPLRDNGHLTSFFFTPRRTNLNATCVCVCVCLFLSVFASSFQRAENQTSESFGYKRLPYKSGVGTKNAHVARSRQTATETPMS